MSLQAIRQIMDTRYRMEFQKRHDGEYENYVVKFLDCISQLNEPDMAPYHWGTSELARGRFHNDCLAKAIDYIGSGATYFASKSRDFRVEISNKRYLKKGNVICFKIDFNDRLEPVLTRSAFLSICRSINPTFAFVSSAEYYSKRHTIHKTIVRGEEILANSTQITGMWIDDRIPGLYWLNLFGKEYEYEDMREKIVRPLGTTESLDCGILIEMNFDIDSMNEEYAGRMLDEGRRLLGEERFFDPKAVPSIIEF